MSVTVSIENNMEFCRRHNLVGQDRYDCMCTDEDGKGHDKCIECKGTGVVAFDVYPFEMNIANGNFSTLWHALGMDFDWCGSIDGRALLGTLKTFDAALAVRAGTDTKENDGPRVIDCGIRYDQASNYVCHLRRIAEEAVRREEQVTWC